MAESVSVFIPQETVNDESVRILSWRFPSGSRVEKEELLCEVETSKATMEIHAPSAGLLMYSAAVGTEVAIGANICEIVSEEQLSFTAAAAHNGNARTVIVSENASPARFTPLALKAAGEYGIDVASFASGTLVRRNDVLRKAGKLPPEPAENGLSQRHTRAGKQPEGSAKSLASAPVPGVPVEWSDLPRRKTIEGAILASGRANTVSSSVTALCRAPKLRNRVEKLGLGAVGLNALVMFELSRLLRKYPVFNAIHEGGRIGHYRAVNVGWAIDGGQQLLVPVVRDADNKSLQETAALMQTQLEAYLEDKLKPADFAGGTVTITDLSADGVSFFHPLISQGQSAILGIGSDSRTGGGELFYLTLAFDHQLAEGRTAANLLRNLRERLEAHAELENEPPIPGTSGSVEVHCMVCQRDKEALQNIKAFLLKSEVPPGLVCSVCVMGW